MHGLKMREQRNAAAASRSDCLTVKLVYRKIVRSEDARPMQRGILVRV